MIRMALMQMVRGTQAAFTDGAKVGRQRLDKRLVTANDQMLKRAEPLFTELHQAAKEAGHDSGGFKSHMSVQTLRSDVRTLLEPVVPVLKIASQLAGEAAQTAGGNYARIAVAINLIAAQRAGSDMANPSLQAVDAIVNYVDSPAFQLILAQYAGYHADQAAEILTQGVADGLNPRTIAQSIVNYISTFPGADALRTARTVQLYSYRAAAHATFQANADVVDQWMWVAQKNGDTCMSCIAMDGTLHDLDETLDDHHNGECAPVPVTKSWADLGFGSDDSGVTDGYQTGIDWFEQQPAADQQAQMGKAAWTAWQDGQFDLSDYPTTYDNPVYGTMRREKSLKELVAA